MMISKKYTLWALNPLLLTMMAPAVAQQTDDETFVVSANRSNRTVAEMAQTTWVIENAELEQQVKHLTAIAEKKAQTVGGAGGTTITSMGSVKGYDEFVGRSFKSTEEMIAQLRLVTGQAISTTADLERLGITYETLADKAKAYTDQLQSGRSIQQDQINDFYAVKTAVEQQVAAYEASRG